MSIFVLPDQEASDSAQKKENNWQVFFRRSLATSLKNERFLMATLSTGFKKFSPLNTWEPAIVESRMLVQKTL